jgi:hypothetical protein
LTEVSSDLQQQFDRQRFSNDYQLVDGVAMRAEHGDRFQIPPDVIKRHVCLGQFVELRIDSPRFSIHQDASEKCYCESCNGETTKPILRHDHPASLLSLPQQNVPSRGWGEDFWVRVVERSGVHFSGVVDNPLYEARLHGVRQDDEIVFHEDHILAVHDIHRQELLLAMDSAQLKELAEWLGRQKDA